MVDYRAQIIPKRKKKKPYTSPSSFVTQVCVTPDNTGSSTGLHSKMQCVKKYIKQYFKRCDKAINYKR